MAQDLLGKMEEVLLRVPCAASIVDMQVAGLPISFVNDAWVALTKYERKEAVGKNCRMLQGAATEEGAVAQLLVSIRERRTCTVCLTNYRKDGSRFRNALTLHPIIDSNGVYRYMLGLASDADAGSEAQRLVGNVKRLMPPSFDASFAAPVRVVEEGKVRLNRTACTHAHPMSCAD